MSTCAYVTRDQPRVVKNRHMADCDGTCVIGCLPCSDAHCRVCGRVHAEGACAECLSATREALHAIGTMCDALPAEVKHRGVEGEAMMLLGPSADPEARGHLEASIAAGRVPVDYLDRADGELHPLFVLGTWDMCWRDALEHDEPAERLTVRSAIGYLDMQMTYMAGFEHVPFEDFARDVRQCQAHLESVLHDKSQGDLANVDCFECGSRIERKLTKTGFEDHWTCQRCRQTYTYAEYNFALRASLEEAKDVTA